MQSKAKTVTEYLAELPEDRRAAISAVRDVILDNLDSEYEEGMSYGMIGYFVPHSVYPAGYHCNPSQPLPFANLASQKNHIALYLMGCYCNTEHNRWFTEAWKATGKKLDMGKSCIRFKRLEDVALDVVGESIRRIPARKFIAVFERALAAPRSGPTQSKSKPKKSTKASKAKPSSKKPKSRKAASRKKSPRR